MVRSRSYIATPPGATIKEQLSDRGMSQKEFAARMHMPEKHISNLLNGDVQLKPETAVKLEMVLGVPQSSGIILRRFTEKRRLRRKQSETMMNLTNQPLSQIIESNTLQQKRQRSNPMPETFF